MNKTHPKGVRARVSVGMLENIQIAKPCPANWDAMTGDERVRFCGKCAKTALQF